MIKPGVDQLAALGLILVPTLGIVFALQARFATDRMKNLTARGVLMVVSLFALLYPDDAIAAIACVPVVLIIAAWVLYQRPRQIRAAKASG